MSFLSRLFRNAETPAEPTDLDARMMRRALELAREASNAGEVPVGAVVYRADTEEIVAEGANRREADNDPAAHAELIAIRNAAQKIGDWRLTGCSLVVTLEPCPMCAGLIVNSRVDRVVYGANDPKAGACRSLFEITTDRRLNHRVELVTGVLAEDCAELLRTFFRDLRKRPRA